MAGTAAVVLTVTTGAYVASLGVPDDAAGRATGLRAAVAPPAGNSAVSAPAPGGSPPAAPVTPSAVSSASVSAGRSSAPAENPAPPRREAAAGTAPAAPARLRAMAEAEAAPIDPASPGRIARYVDRLVSLANTERAKAGCAALRSDARLRKAAQAHADDMSERDYYDHDSPEGRNAGDRITAAGYSWSTWAENIHRGPKTATQAMREWMDSEGHRRNILNCSFKDIGVGVRFSPNGPWWVQNFAAKR
ncbi:CAP domain-containing protein [Streptomyces sp. NPDC003027]